MNLYEALDIDKDATPQEVKRAYRKAASRTHPDKEGGSSESFAIVKRAKDILCDPEKRRKYDETGEESEDAPDNTHSDAVNFLMQEFNKVLGQIDGRGGDYTQFDIIGDLKKKISIEISNGEQFQQSVKRKADKCKKMLGRFKSKGKVNYFENMINSKLTEFNKQIEMSERQIKMIKIAYDIVNDFSFDFEAPHPAQNYTGSLPMYGIPGFGAF